MKNVPAVANALRTRHNVEALPKAVIEWNMNRYFGVEVKNNASEVDYGYDVDLFPIESIAEPWRPTKGINKARVGHSMVSGNYNDWPRPKFFVPSEDDQYKYWISPFASDSSGALSWCAPQVVYDTRFRANKLKVVVENTWTSPTVHRIEYTNDGGATWIGAIWNPTIANDGTIEAYWNGSTWTQTRPADTTQTVEMNGIRYVVDRLGWGILADGSRTYYRDRGAWWGTTGQGYQASIIEVAACLVRDVSDLLISCEDTFDAGEASVVSPVGTLTTNTGSITFWNEDNLFSTENTNSPYHRLIEQNAEVNLSYIYDIDGTKHEVQQFKMYADDWTGNDNDGTMTVSVSDSSKHLNQIKPNRTKFENMRFTEIMYRILDSVGWNYYNIDASVRERDFVVPIFWTSGDETVWEVLDDLASVSQSVIYVDEYGKLNIKTREDAFAPDAQRVWNLRGETAGSELADIESVTEEGEVGSNVVKVIYKNTKWADVNNGFTENSVVWEADDPTVLRSSPLIRNLEPEDTRFVMAGGEAATWPYTGKAVIEGEIIEYDAKMFVYQQNGGRYWQWISSQAEYDDFNSRVGVELRQWNYFDGQFRIKERGVWNTPIKRHLVDISDYNVVRWTVDGTRSGGGFHHDKRLSWLGVRTAGLHKHSPEYVTLTKGTHGDSPWRWIGTKMVFHSTNAVHQAAGIVWNMQNGRDGYYAEIIPSSQINEKLRETRHEFAFYVIKNGEMSPMFPIKGEQIPVALDMWGELEVWNSVHDNRVKIFFNGKQVFHVLVPARWQLPQGGKFGLFARGSTDASFDYLYASSQHAQPEPDAQYSSMHTLAGIVVGREFVRDWIYRNTRKQRLKRKKTNKAIFDKRQRFMDDFGPYVHEMREFDVKFDPAPVKASRLFSTNDYAAHLIDYRSDAFGAKFTMVNTERGHAVLKGEDSMLAPGSETPATQHLNILGQALVIEDGEEIVVKNDQQVRARGEIVTEIDSDWIQSKEAAQEIADWILRHWSNGADVLTVSVFGNPLLHIGDVVGVHYPLKDMSLDTHEYFVTSVSTSFDEGMSTTLSLRRRN